MVSLGTLIGTVEIGLKLNAISDVMSASEYLMRFYYANDF